MVKGIDVSSHQGTVDFKAVKKDGIDFVILRAGYGNTESQTDAYFHRNYEKAKEAGLPVGVYWFSYARSVAEAKTEAKVCLKVLNKRKLQLPVFFDWEYDSMRYAKENGITPSKTQITNMCKAFLEIIEKAGYIGGVYASSDILNRWINYDKLNQYQLWIGHYGIQEKPSTYPSAEFWQYTDVGHVKGISGNVDLNIAYDLKPAVAPKKTKTQTKEYYVKGKDYVLQNEMCVRKGPGITYGKVGYSGLTADGKKHDRDCDGYLDTGTTVTCQEVFKRGKDIWIRIPSGWIAAYFKGVRYVR